MPKSKNSNSRSPDTQSRQNAGAPKRAALSSPPYNPGLQKLVEDKQARAFPLDDEAKAEGFLGWHQRGYLPHFDVPWVTQLVTIRLADSLPASRRSEWEHLLKIEDDRERRRRLEACLDLGWGECWLRQPPIAALVENALRFFAGERYALAAWVIMPNHLHVLVEVWDTPLSQLAKSWKDFTAREANKLQGRRGVFWEREYLDTLIKGEDHRQRAVRYIDNNPVKAKLARSPADNPWSSARFRDEFGRLKIPKAAETHAVGAPASCRLKP